LKKNEPPFVYQKIYSILKKKGHTLHIKEVNTILSRPLCITKNDTKIIIKEMEKYGLIETTKHRRNTFIECESINISARISGYSKGFQSQKYVEVPDRN